MQIESFIPKDQMVSHVAPFMVMDNSFYQTPRPLCVVTDNPLNTW